MKRHIVPASHLTRRSFIDRSLCTTFATAAAAGGLLSTRRLLGATPSAGKPALLGGSPIHSGSWPDWPISDQAEEEGLIHVLRGGNWNRYFAGEQGTVASFERRWASDIGTSYCQATNSGTSALVSALAAMQIGPGDEVLVPPYTFVATVNCVLLHHALPVFVDSDPETGLMDAETIAARINENTRAILPVHIAGAPCDMDRILAIAGRHGLKIVEDACQAHTAEWKERRVGSIGDAGCFSFQHSKNATSGEGGALTTNHKQIYARAQAFQNNGSGRAGDDGAYTANGSNLRFTEFQGALLLAQLERNDELARRREENGAYLDTLLKAIAGVSPKKTYPGTTRHGYHLYMFHYEPDEFAGMRKEKFTAALQAEGIPVSGGYAALNKQPFVERFLSSTGFQRIYSAERLKQYRQENHCPANDRMIETTCWLSQNVLLGSKHDMEAIAGAIEKTRKHAADLLKAS
jgi:dTDP-4-amino-4,6-dideoxygalactose transaminase